ncbi:MAG: 2-phospho-L-lactate transferase [Candidatus Bathyarchaeia archaeon]
MLTILAGGVGAAKFLQGLTKIVPESELSIIVNTGDDIELYGLHISPDLDIITYTLSGIVDEKKGWGIHKDSFNCLKMLGKYGLEEWFKLGDKDLATHIYRSKLLKNGFTLSEATKRICQALGVKAKIIPMTNSKVETQIMIKDGAIHFQEYLVKRKAKDEVINVKFNGAENAEPCAEALDALKNSEGIIISPSNPIVSIGPILAIKGFKETLKNLKNKVLAITPIIQNAPVKGPADKLMKGLGLKVSAYTVATLYKEFITYFVLDRKDLMLKSEIENLNIKVIVTNTLMKSLKDKVKLANVILTALKERKEI